MVSSVMNALVEKSDHQMKIRYSQSFRWTLIALYQPVRFFSHNAFIDE